MSYTNPVEGQTFDALCYFDGKLLATVRNNQSGYVGVMAMAGT